MMIGSLGSIAANHIPDSIRNRPGFELRHPAGCTRNTTPPGIGASEPCKASRTGALRPGHPSGVSSGLDRRRVFLCGLRVSAVRSFRWDRAPAGARSGQHELGRGTAVYGYYDGGHPAHGLGHYSRSQTARRGFQLPHTLDLGGLCARSDHAGLQSATPRWR